MEVEAAAYSLGVTPLPRPVVQATVVAVAPLVVAVAPSLVAPVAPVTGPGPMPESGAHWG